MNKKISCLGFLALLLSFSTIIQAQPPGGEPPMGPPPEIGATNSNEVTSISSVQMDWMKKKLKLTHEQELAADKITQEYVKKVLDLRKKENYNASTDTGKKTAEQIRDEALKKILTEKQFSKFVKNKAILDNAFDNAVIGGMPPPPPGL